MLHTITNDLGDALAVQVAIGQFEQLGAGYGLPRLRDMAPTQANLSVLARYRTKKPDAESEQEEAALADSVAYDEDD